MNNDRVFLRRVAEFCVSGDIGCPLSEICFVLPNKRAALFLKKYMREAVDSVTMMPRFMTMRTLVDIFADVPQGADLQLLFTLYDAYRNVMCNRGRTTEIREFDSFIFWGDMMLSDFDDMDKSLVNADEIFRIIRDTKEIVADYLDDEQKEVIRSVWGENRLTACVTEFWTHLSENAPEGSVTKDFVYIWEILADIYHEFDRLLKQKNIATVGQQYRAAVKSAVQSEKFSFGGNVRYVFVGFNDLSHAETMVFERLKKAGIASFFWDTSPMAMCNGGEGLPASLERLEKLVGHFPAPDGFEPDAGQDVPEITVTAVPSNVGQAKAVGKILREWLDKGYIDKEDPMNTAIVMPDQGLLLPTLMSLPDDISSVNISMGLPFRTTAFAILLNSIISMQLHARKSGGIWCYYFPDVIQVLQHPHIQAIASKEADAVSTYISEGKVYNISAAEITRIAPALVPVFTPLQEQGDVRMVSRYLCGMLGWMGEKLGESGKSDQPGFELRAIDFFLGELDKLTTLVIQHDVTMRNHTFLQLFERVFSSRALALSGKPLQGLQILGVLETRALDFDNVIVLSMNDGVFPRKQYARTMIPNNLRRGFDLPDFDSLEWTYSYSFFRLVARAKHVAILYDARADGRGKGERSRYISQMQYIMPRIQIADRQTSLGAQSAIPAKFEVEKTPEVMKELARFKAGGDLRVSTSAIKEYLQCPFSFYLKYVRSFRGSDELVNYLTNAEYGTIVHNTIQRLFEPFAGQLVGAAQFDRWLSECDTMIENVVTEELMSIRSHSGNEYKLDAEEQIAREAIATIVRSDLAAEQRKYCNPNFTFIANEKKVNTLSDGTIWKIDDDLSLNFYMSVDRVDRLDAGHLRFIDFKTGNEESMAENIEGVFKRGSSKKHGIFQLFTYCEAYLSLVDPSMEIVPHIHPMRDLAQGKDIPDMRIARKPVTGYAADVREQFRPRLHELLHEIFGPKGSFGQCQDDDVCEFCNFASLCGRLKKE